MGSQIVSGVLGAGAKRAFPQVFPMALAVAAGAMLFVISEEIIPETHSWGRSCRPSMDSSPGL